MPIGWAIVIVVLWLTVISLTVIVLGVLRQVMPLLERSAAQQPAAALPMPAQGLTLGSKLPGLVARDRDGNVVNTAQLLGRPSVLLFLSSSCLPCVGLGKELAGWDAGELASFLYVVTDPDSLATLRVPAWLAVLTLPEGVQADVLGVRGRPFVMAADQDGFVRSKQMLNTVAQLTDFATAAVSAAEEPVAAELAEDPVAQISGREPQHAVPQHAAADGRAPTPS
jgi:hypothetical protein